MEVRLQKFLAEAGCGSRRACETLITAGRIHVNGQPVTTLGTKVVPGRDAVTLDGEPVAAERKVYLMLHKPAGFHCTNRDPQGRRRAIDLLPSSLPQVHGVGRLDANSEGLLLFTNDGSFSLRLTHPRYKTPKVYAVWVAGRITTAQTRQWIRGVREGGEWLRAERVAVVRSDEQISELRVVLREGRNRQIRRMATVVGCPVRRLVRLAIGGVELGNLKPGQWRYLTDEEVEQLRHGDCAGGSDAAGRQ